MVSQVTSLLISITHILLTITNVFERSSKSVSLQPALLQIQKAEMDSSDCVFVME
jgi:hypothetical protein